MTEPLPLVIVANGGAAAEFIAVVQNPRPGSTAYRVVGLVGSAPAVDDLAERLGVPLHPTLATAGDASHFDAIHFVVATDDVAQRRAVVAEGTGLGMSPATIVHADATIGPWVTIGEGTLVSPGARLTGNVTVGRHCQLHTGAIASHDDVLGDYVTLSPSSTLCGGVSVGDGSTIFAGATVMPGVRIGSDVIVGAGALVNQDVADGMTVVGVPAKPLNR